MLDQRHRVALDEVGRPLDVVGGEGVGDGLGHQVVAREPHRCALVQPRHLLGAVALQPSAQVVGEQVVVAEPLALGVERPQEEVTALELLEHRLAVGPGRERPRQIAAQPVADRGDQQELQDVGGQGAEHVLGEVLADGVVAAGEVADQSGGIGGVAQRQRHELQGRDPAVRALGEPRDVVALQRQPVEVDEERAGLVDVEAQRRGVDLGQLAADPQPGERQARAGAAGEDQRHVGRREVQQVDQRVVHLRVVDQVPVVERQHEPSRVLRDQLQQRGKRVAPGVLGALLDQLPQIAEGVAGLRECPAHGLQQVRQEPVGVVVVAVQAEPGDRTALVLHHP